MAFGSTNTPYRADIKAEEVGGQHQGGVYVQIYLPADGMYSISILLPSTSICTMLMCYSLNWHTNVSDLHPKPTLLQSSKKSTPSIIFQGRALCPTQRHVELCMHNPYLACLMSEIIQGGCSEITCSRTMIF